MNRKRMLTLSLCALCLVSLMALPVRANSAQRYWQGVLPTGSLVQQEDCPLVVEQETLLFSLPEFPKTHYDSAEELLNYPGQVTAEYQILNPSDYTVTAQLLFPFGPVPSYSYVYDPETMTAQTVLDTEKFDILLDGQPIRKALRHSLFLPGDTFDVRRDLPRIRDGYAETWDLPAQVAAYYGLDGQLPEPMAVSPITLFSEYRWRVPDMDQKNHPAATWGLTLPPELRAMVILPQLSGSHLLPDGSLRLGCDVRPGDELVLYLLEPQSSYQPQWQLYADGGCADGEELPAQLEALPMSGCTLRSMEELALMHRPPDSPVSTVDWYNAVIDAMYYGNPTGTMPMVVRPEALHPEQNFMRWYAYELTLGPGQRAVNRVTAPMYPDIDLGYESAAYDYAYLLSPASTWVAFGPIHVEIHTPYNLVSENHRDFTPQDYGYSLDYAGLPEGELHFRLSTGEAADFRMHSLREQYLPTVLILGGAAILVTLGAARRRKRH